MVTQSLTHSQVTISHHNLVSSRVMSRYYNISAVLMEQELVPVVFNIAATGLGHLDPSASSVDVRVCNQCVCVF